AVTPGNVRLVCAVCGDARAGVRRCAQTPTRTLHSPLIPMYRRVRAVAIFLPHPRAMTSVLIVDDEPAVRDIMARWVKSLGLRSHTAESADEALATLRTQHYDLAVIHVMMPGHDGLWRAHDVQ